MNSVMSPSSEDESYALRGTRSELKRRLFITLKLIYHIARNVCYITRNLLSFVSFVNRVPDHVSVTTCFSVTTKIMLLPGNDAHLRKECETLLAIRDK